MNKTHNNLEIFLKNISFISKPFLIGYTFLFVFLSTSFFAAEVGIGKDFSKITISEGVSIISEDSNFNAQIVNKEIQVLNSTFQIDAKGVIVIISQHNTLTCNDHISHHQTQRYQEKEFKIQEPAIKKTREYTKIKDFNDDYVSSVPFLPSNFITSKYGSIGCLIINLFDYKISLESNTSELYYIKSLIKDLQHQKYYYENKLLLFLKTESFFTRPPPYKAILM